MTKEWEKVSSGTKATVMVAHTKRDVVAEEKDMVTDQKTAAARDVKKLNNQTVFHRIENGPPPGTVFFDVRYSFPYSNNMDSINARWLYACGKLPSKRLLRISTSSENNPT